MCKFTRWILVALMCMAALALVGVAYAQPVFYPRLEAEFAIYGWREAPDTPGDLMGTLQVFPKGGDGNYTYEFIGLHYTRTFEFQWRACSVLVNSLRVWSGDGQRIDVPVWRDNLPCPPDRPINPPDDEDDDDC
jgi:hypothetical protein